MKLYILLILICFSITDLYSKGITGNTKLTNLSRITAENFFLSARNFVTNRVAPVYGINQLNDPPDILANPGARIFFRYYVTNKGNVSDNIIISLSTFVTNTNPLYPSGNWKASIYTNTNSMPVGGIITSRGGGACSFTKTLSPNEAFRFYSGITTTNTASPKSWGFIQVQAKTTNKPATNYTGVNMTNYGGYSNVDDSGPMGTDPSLNAAGTNGHSVVIIKAPVINISKWIDNVIPPSGYPAGALPFISGATISYTILYTNAGTDTATNMTIIDYLPITNIVFAPGTINTNSLHPGGSFYIEYSRDGIIFSPTPIAFGGTKIIRFTSRRAGVKVSDKGTIKYKIIIK